MNIQTGKNGAGKNSRRGSSISRLNDQEEALHGGNSPLDGQNHYSPGGQGLTNPTNPKAVINRGTTRRMLRETAVSTGWRKVPRAERVVKR